MHLERRQFLQLTAISASASLVGACASDNPLVEVDRTLPVSPFGAESTAEEVTQGLDLSGQTALVTGCNSGLGFETMRVLALRGAHVIGTGRTLEKAQTACDSIDGETTPAVLELSDFQSCVDCAAFVTRLGRGLDMLVCNAGINTFGQLELVNGIEKMFVVNFLGHFVLVHHLLPMMVEAGSGRVINISSRSGYEQAPAVGIDFDNLRGEKTFDARQAYGRSKLANALFSLELAQRLEDTGVTSNALHPGLVKTNIARTAPFLVRKAFDLFGPVVAKTPAQGAATQVYVATNPALSGVNGAYFEDCKPVIVGGEHHMTDRAMARRLWSEAEKMTAAYMS